MTLPAPAPRNPRPGRPPGGLHYSWVIVGILVVIQVIGSAISQSAGGMVAPLRDPHGPFGWGIGTIGAVIVVHRQYFGAGPTSTLYGWEMMGALLGHAVATGLAGLVLYVRVSQAGGTRGGRPGLQRACPHTSETDNTRHQAGTRRDLIRCGVMVGDRWRSTHAGR